MKSVSRVIIIFLIIIIIAWFIKATYIFVAICDETLLRRFSRFTDRRNGRDRRQIIRSGSSTFILHLGRNRDVTYAYKTISFVWGIKGDVHPLAPSTHKNIFKFVFLHEDNQL